MTILDVRFTETAVFSIQDQEEHLAEYHPAEVAAAKIDTLIDDILTRLQNAPVGYPVSRQASDLGVTRYRELNHDGYRVFYEVYEHDNAIAVELVLRQKQDVEAALIRYCLVGI
ncbi:type II toxin-antitoxin system RelE/ParE family toxin [Pseudomonas sp. ZM23]|uniref:Type II toxin-antitoxin system RelE/ParE family toxin n=1 Tax=Pseudomonas triclosanedens TaxID=2961893 RepID=A0ABY7A293_9PSED|nr:type II toxin-antitoxin system RelE/ParE family toxin [Pseudomonas triclosanedens]MCP8467742.1 type II toxin-antitoxin system RelE/ParE family toxin [Pseudomonas triclosanedens]MCP8473709.1 type II toxin-antitoxin system RelE/ParE family toxin [Pseudomonas triclosanedens]MCP8479631.1 type II toxin-antitoxin system RelE/ParE family toxin [Pseudomonas triclosanedens]WAI51317.1 type II toxin-antitoxin system RelE/ParE family toxin [Pseudomonas triclosanedens]